MAIVSLHEDSAQMLMQCLAATEALAQKCMALKCGKAAGGAVKYEAYIPEVLGQVQCLVSLLEVCRVMHVPCEGLGDVVRHCLLSCCGK